MAEIDNSVAHAKIVSDEKVELLRMDLQKDVEKCKLDLKSQQLSSGWLSVVFGTEAEKSGNIAGFVILLLVVVIGVIIFASNDSAAFSRKDAIAPCVSIVTLALGYLFGRAGAKSRSDHG